MTTFWIVAGLLLAAALLFVLPPLISGPRRRAAAASRREANVSIYRDQLAELDADLAAGTISPEQHAQARREVESRVLEDVSGEGAAAAEVPAPSRLPAIAVGVAVPVLAVAVYLVIGNPKGLDPQQAAPRAAAGQGHEVTPDQIAQMVEALAERLKQSPENVQGWTMLARSYNALGKYPEAAQAYAQAVQRAPNDAQLLADYADVLAMTQGRDLAGEPERLIRRAVEIDPNNIKGLALLGTAEFNRQNFAAAAAAWQKIMPLIPPESDFARNLQASIAEAQQKAGGAPAPAAKVSGRVSLDPALAARAAPGDTVFVFARAAQGSRMPLAIVRKQVKDLPAEFALDDSMAMSPNMKLSSVPQVIVGARVSKSGNAAAQPGDLEGLSQPVAPGAAGLAIVIDREVR